MKIVFWGSSDFSLSPLVQLSEMAKIVAVVTQPDKRFGRGMKKIHQTPVKLFALEHGISVFQPVSLKTESIYNDLLALSADLFVVVSYGKILPDIYLNMTPHGAINLHASLLPVYRGASPVQTALLNGDSETGNTIQVISPKLDTGDILFQSRVAIGPEETAPELFDKLSKDGAMLLCKAVRAIEKGKITLRPQNEAEAVNCKVIKKCDGNIDFRRETAVKIFNKYRAFYLWPGIRSDFYDHEKQIKHPVSFTKIAINDKISGVPGLILRADKKAFVVACKEAAISILKIKPAGKHEMDFHGFINGYKPKAGQSFYE